MNVFFSKLFRYKDKKSPDKLGLYPANVHILSIPERRYLWTARIMVICGAFSCCVTIMLALSIYLLLPQKGAMPKFYEISDAHRQLTPSEPAEKIQNSIPLVTEELIGRYIKLRHEIPYSYANLLYRWDENSEFFQLSSLGVYHQFMHKMDRKAIQRLVDLRIKRFAEIDFIRQLTNELWEAQFRTKTITEDSLEPEIAIWKAYLRIKYITIEDNPEEQEGVKSFDYTQNPYGFRVQSYSLGYVGKPEASDHYLDIAKQVFEARSEE